MFMTKNAPNKKNTSMLSSSLPEMNDTKDLEKIFEGFSFRNPIVILYTINYNRTLESKLEQNKSFD